MIKNIFFTATILLLFSNVNNAQNLAFPEAEGFGKYTTGGKGGFIYKVTNLNDDGEGSLRKGIVKKGARIIVFDVSGTIELKSKLDINKGKGDVSILGQTAPGEGITIKGYPFTIKGDNVIIRYLRFRMGDVNKIQGDALGCGNSKNVIIDHCSISWGTDENASFYNNKNFTLQWCIISEALNNSVHNKGAHGYGGIWGGVNASFHHNLIVSNNSRNPRFSGSKTTANSENEFVDFRNNVIYNWGDNSIYGGENGTYNMINNYFKSGPATTSSKLDRIVSPSKPYGKFYVDGNFVVGYENITKNNWNGGVQCDDLEATKLEKEISIANNIKTSLAVEAYTKVLENAGASIFRDRADLRVVKDTKEGKTSYKNGIIDSQEEVGGWPILTSEKSKKDSDEDGMPDEWEIKNKLNPEKVDANLNTLDKNYTNIEVYTNSLVKKKSVAKNITLPENYVSEVWVADLGNGSYKNPILHADYSDPDVIRVGTDYYMTASSFNATPGLPILHSKDMVNWKLINHAIQQQLPATIFDIPQHGNGVWAPSIRYHKNEFYIYWGDPDYGIYMVKTKNPLGVWDKPILVMEGKGLIDPSPLWDDSGDVYLVHAYAGSRRGVKSLLTINKMNSEGTKVIDQGIHVFDGHKNQSTIEGPKFYKRNGYYYIFAPAGGVATGWQLVLRSKDIYGPYEEKIVLEQGTTNINGPHQGAWVDTPNGESWFYHFQDLNAYGRIVHLQPMSWKNDWPIMGTDFDGNGIGEPVSTSKKPTISKTYSIETPAETDNFDNFNIGLQWQWQANSDVVWHAKLPGNNFLRLFSIKSVDDSSNLWMVPNLLLQKFPAPNFTASTKISLFPEEAKTGKTAGLIIMGMDYATLSISHDEKGYILKQTQALEAIKNGKEKTNEIVRLKTNAAYFKVIVSSPNAMCQFLYSENGIDFKEIGEPFKAKEGKWIGAKVGLFSVSTQKANRGGYADIEYFKITKKE